MLLSKNNSFSLTINSKFSTIKLKIHKNFQEFHQWNGLLTRHNKWPRHSIYLSRIQSPRSSQLLERWTPAFRTSRVNCRLPDGAVPARSRWFWSGCCPCWYRECFRASGPDVEWTSGACTAHPGKFGAWNVRNRSPSTPDPRLLLDQKVHLRRHWKKFEKLSVKPILSLGNFENCFILNTFYISINQMWSGSGTAIFNKQGLQSGRSIENVWGGTTGQYLLFHHEDYASCCLESIPQHQKFGVC